MGAMTWPDGLEQLAGESGPVWVGSVVSVVVMIAAARWLLDPADTGKVRVPAVLLLLHLGLVALSQWAVPLEGPISLAAFFLLLVALGRIGFVLFADALLRRRAGHPLPKIFRDIGEGLVYTAILLVTLRRAGAQLDALLTTSALLTAVIGLSLQDTLGNLFAGLSIQAQNPFEVGDWIRFDGGSSPVVGRVVEINWRATRVLTLDQVEVIIPNGPLARASIANFTKPARRSRRSVRLVVPFAHPPQRVHQVLRSAVVGVAGVAESPEPSVLTEEFEERGIRYWVRYFTDDFEKRESIDAAVRDRLWYALRRADIEFARPQQRVEVRHEDESADERSQSRDLDRRKLALSRIDFLGTLGGERLEMLAERSKERLYGAGETVIRQGEPGHEFYIVQGGEVAVSVARDGVAVELTHLGAGAFFGEMSVMTGEPRAATVAAVAPTQLLVVPKFAIASVLESSPELAEHISDVLAGRRRQLDRAVSVGPSPAEPVRAAERHELLGRIKHFFSLSGLGS